MEELNQSKEVKVQKVRKAGFVRVALVPFICGILGAALVLGTCFGIPSIKALLLKDTNKSNTSAKIELGKSAVTQISLTDYSDTSIDVADNVLPSIVGIEIEYTVSSAFSMRTSTATASGSGVIMTEDGYILTNNHVINSAADYGFYSLSEANKIVVYLYNDDTEYEA